MNSEKGRLEEKTNKGGGAFINPRWRLSLLIMIMMTNELVMRIAKFNSKGESPRSRDVHGRRRGVVQQSFQQPTF